ncbi:Helix-hairpin-helix domain-containing protein [Halogranum amylolyticum]|uniref:Helix-hairpin-helix domain-containing protein n=1 Tax=Halogranum amylolyticum TaxID=660520 RepID=A0A1H8QE38_9EURY|nr:helix-hairpin-helix domain-containing protein [Halogranum amylolyticum]SEO52500.1 Helix-hairpin-helix domain-containing protein [Halogranum amylolyticum]
MKVVLEDGTVIDCGGYKALDTGLVLTEDPKRKHVVGFVPHDRLRFVLPDDALGEGEHGDGTAGFVPDDERQRRIDELEAQVAALEAQIAELATERTATAGSETSESGESEPEDLTVIDGIGPKYAERLTAAGITTFRALRAADVVDVAEATGVSEERAAEWIDATRTARGDRETDDRAASEESERTSTEESDDEERQEEATS